MEIEQKKDIIFSQIKKFCALKSFQEKSLEDYVLDLLRQNQDFNFIGKSTIENIWERHILDSAQLFQFIKNKDAKFADFGSGAGLPGIILSIMGIKEIHLIEKSFRKAEFLRKAKLLSSNRVFVHQSKIEELSNLNFDCVVSRALAPLPELFSYVINFLKKDGYCLFLKGKNLSKEIDLAKNKFNFEYILHQSMTSKESNIIEVFNLNKI